MAAPHTSRGIELYTQVSRIHAFRLPDGLRHYPWRAVALAMAGLALAMLLGSAAINAAFAWRVRQIDPAYTALSGTCYFAGDARHYTRIALNGYSDYDLALLPPHYAQLNDRGWWPLFPALASGVIALGGGACSGQIVNGLSFVLLVPVFQALTRERRALALLALAVLPFGAWLYVGGADTLLLLLSGLLALAARAGATRPRAASLAALALGALVGLTEPHGLLLIPAFGAWSLGLAASRVWMRSADEPRSLWRLVLEDASPAWAPFFAALGIALGAGAWLYQASGHYPLWPLMIMRTRAPAEFVAWSPGAFARTFQDAIALAWRDQLSMPALQRGVELAALVFGLALAFGRQAPLWPQSERIRLPLHWRVGILTPLMIMFAIGQSHALERALASSVFVALAWHRLVFGEPGQIVRWKLASFPGLIRWLWLLAGPALWLLSFLLLGWEPLV